MRPENTWRLLFILFWFQGILGHGSVLEKASEAILEHRFLERFRWMQNELEKSGVSWQEFVVRSPPNLKQLA
jgi:hypothetical protein